MFHHTFYPHDAAVPPSSLPGWEETPGSFHGSNHSLTGFEEASRAVSHFDHDVDKGLQSAYATMALQELLNEPDPVGNWTYLPTHSPTLPLTDDASTTAYSASQAASPASSTTLFDSPDQFTHNVQLPWAGNALANQPVAVSPARLHEFALPSQTVPTFGMPTLSSSSVHPQQAPYDDKLAYSYWPGQQPSQYEVGAAAVVAPDLALGMELSEEASALIAFSPILFPFDSLVFPEPLQVPVVSNQPQWIPANDKCQLVVEPAAEPCHPVGDSHDGDAEAPKKKRKQSTEKRYQCEFPGCTASAYTIFPRFPLLPVLIHHLSRHPSLSVSARSHNIKIHMDSVHRGLRGHRCDAPGCPRAFSRRHDLLRHRISAHTNLGSPRNANNAKATKRAIAALKKDEHEV
ncbi:transcription factor [Ganoderma sinense ZZ0214-1]|uniref:Transcription factor n=1 Tax=Ganoderma sinense ZZ0214-1 TaxID=1077348 RepID=A0A2G8RPK1_9APHY|nr:transcription factor [Ganoderma sinense ZZ0214-1]